MTEPRSSEPHSSEPRPSEPRPSEPRPRVLCVDDEPRVLAGLARTLRPCCDVQTAPGGRAGLALLAADPGITVVISDLRMPGLDGATFLACVRRVAPDATRILLTGQANLEGAMAAVNEGQVFRFLLKPIAGPLLQAAVDAAVAQHRLVTAERVLLEETVQGCIAALVDLLALSHPAAFGRATRLKRLVAELAARLELPERWPVEVAAMLSQVGVLTLPATLGARVCSGDPLTREERTAALGLPMIAERLIAGIPRLERVRAILRDAATPDAPHDSAGGADPDGGPPEPAGGGPCALDARVLRLALAFDELESQGIEPTTTLGVLERRADADDAPVLDALRALAGAAAERRDVREMRLSEVQPAMVFATDVSTAAGLLLVARGQEVTRALAERIRSHWGAFAPSLRVHMIVPAPASAGARMLR